MGPQSRGTTGRESRRAPQSMAPGDLHSLRGTGLATQFLWPRPPQTCSAGSHLLGTPGRAAQSCAPQPWRSTPERGRVVPMPPVREDHSPRVPLEYFCALMSPALSISVSVPPVAFLLQCLYPAVVPPCLHPTIVSCHPVQLVALSEHLM